MIDEYSRKCPAIRVGFRTNSHDVPEVLSDLLPLEGKPEHIRSDNGPEFTSGVLKQWLSDVGVQTVQISPGCPWENGSNESFNGRFRYDFLNEEEFRTVKEARALTEVWRQHCNHERPHSALEC